VSGASHKQTHRGLGPKDERLFAGSALPKLRAAVDDLCWLLNRGYALRSAVELVGNRYTLVSRQRMAVMRCACSHEAAALRRQREVQPEQVKGRELWLDGYNVLTILETALGGGFVLLGRDGCCRDVLGIHRRHRKIEETFPALRLIGEITTDWSVSRVRWCLDKPVSNSGRLKTLLLETAKNADWNWEVELMFNPDRALAGTEQIVATSDAAILDKCQRWVNLARLLIEQRTPQARIVEL
jgi:hypothetical protein